MVQMGVSNLINMTELVSGICGPWWRPRTVPSVPESPSWHTGQEGLHPSDAGCTAGLLQDSVSFDQT